jgi:polysaccharide deacetylase family protein (PEP-CTERM system associated)
MSTSESKDTQNPQPKDDSPGEIVNALTVDVEDYFHVEAFRSVVGRENWDDYELRVESSTLRILDLFDRHDVKATFFTLGWVARKCPRIVEEIVQRGHELGCHSYWHRMIYTLTPDEFRADTEEATRVLEDIGGVPVRAYRAPCYSVTPRSTWALDVLAELGYTLDSSVFPVRHDLYGFDGFPRFPVNAQLPGGSEIVEFPMTTVRKLGQNLPGPGGGYLRIFPSYYSRRALAHVHRVERQPGVVYLHPWEVDPDQPRIRGPLKSRLRHYTGLRSMERKLEALLTRFRFATMSEVLAKYPPQQSFEVPASVDCVS